MRDKDRDMSSTDTSSPSDRDWSGNIGSDSSGHDDRLRNEEDEYSPDMNDEEDDLQERQREGNLGNERVRKSER